MRCYGWLGNYSIIFRFYIPFYSIRLIKQQLSIIFAVTYCGSTYPSILDSKCKEKHQAIERADSTLPLHEKLKDRFARPGIISGIDFSLIKQVQATIVKVTVNV